MSDELPRVWGTHLPCPEEITEWWRYVYLDRLYGASTIHVYLCVGPILQHAPARLYRRRFKLGEAWPLEVCLWPRRWGW